jgi:hypothetical protein
LISIILVIVARKPVAQNADAYIYAEVHNKNNWITVDVQFGNNGPDTLLATSVQCFYSASLGKAYIFNAGVWAIAHHLWWEEEVYTHVIDDSTSVEFAFDATNRQLASAHATKRNLETGQSGSVNLQIRSHPGAIGVIRCILFDDTREFHSVANTTEIPISIPGLNDPDHAYLDKVGY